MARLVAGWGEVLLLGLLAAGCGGESTGDRGEEAAGGTGGGVAASGGTGGDAGGSAASSGGSAGDPFDEGGATGNGGVTASGGLSGSGGTGGTGGASGSGGIDGSGGASGSGGIDGSGGASGGGGIDGSGGASGGGGVAGAGGSAAGAPPLGEGFECAVPEDCALDQAGCGCVASPVEGATVELPLDCSHDRCSELGVTEADVTCLRGRCSLGIDCDYAHALCKAMAPDCPEGMTPSVEGDCWGPCVPVETCAPSTGIWAGDDRGLFAGVWLIGWEGGLLHFSAIRLPLEADGGFEGEVEILADPGLDQNLPYFDCSGVGTFTVGANSANFTVDPPSDCDGTMERMRLWFSEFRDADGRWGSTLMATVETAPGESVVGYWFSPETCDATMSRCTFGGP